MPHDVSAEWFHRYLVYPFSVGSNGHRTIDLTRCETFTFSSTPQAAELRYRDRYLAGQLHILGAADDVCQAVV